MRKAKKEINYSRLILKYVGLTVAWTVGVYGVIYSIWTAGAWAVEHSNEINGWYVLLFVIFVLCCFGNTIDMIDEIHYLKGDKLECDND